MPGNPATTPRLKLPRYAGSDPADYPSQTNAIVDLLDPLSGLGGVPLVTQTLTSQPILEVGAVGQIRAGRQLALADFTALGLSAPAGLWNLSNLTDASGNNRALTNKNAVAFVPGINGAAATAAQFRGASGTPANDPALYIDAAGGSANFNIATGSWGCWFRTAKRGVDQALISKWGATNQYSWMLYIVAGSNTVRSAISTTGANYGFGTGVSDVCDDRWHFAVVTFDATQSRVYLDGVLEIVDSSLSGALFVGTSPLNIGGQVADSVSPAGAPHYGRIDEAFVTPDVLTEDQIRNLYAAKFTHTLGVQPKNVSLSVRRQRRGAPPVSANFSTAPLRLYNLGSPVETDEGSGNVPLVWQGGGGAGPCAGADGKGSTGAIWTTGGHYATTDTGLPAGLSARSYGCWFKTTSTVPAAIVSWGTIPGSNGRNILYTSAAGNVVGGTGGGDSMSGPVVTDGQWHHVIVTEDNTAADGVKRKLYLDGRVVGNSLVQGSLTLGGVNRFRIGADTDGALPFTGQIDMVFITNYAMTGDEVLRLYNKGGQAMPASPKNAGDHVEAMDSSSVLFLADTLDAQHSIDLTLT